MVINRRLDPPLANDPDRVALDEPLILDAPLIRKIAATGKPMITSTGMATVAELDETVRAAREAGGQDLVLLKCTSTGGRERLLIIMLLINNMQMRVIGWISGYHSFAPAVIMMENPDVIYCLGIRSTS